VASSRQGLFVTTASGGFVAGEQQVRSTVLTAPNAISLLRLLLVPVFALLVVRHHDGWAFVVLAVSGVSDWLDGVVARRFNQVSRLGQMLDPAADRLYILVTIVVLAWRAIVPWWLVALIVVRDLVLAAVLPTLARRGYGPLPVHFAGKAGTAALLYAFPLLLLSSRSDAWGTFGAVTGWAFAWWGITLYWLAGAVYLRQARTLSVGTATA